MDKDQQQLIKKYKSSKAFYKQMVQADKNYEMLEQKGLYLDQPQYQQEIFDKFPLEQVFDINDKINSSNNNNERENVKKNQTTHNIILKDLRVIPNDLYFYYGMMQPQNINTQNLAAHFIKKLPKPSIGYILVYLNNFQNPNAAADLAQFKKMLLTLPFQYFAKLRKFIIMKSTFFFQKELFYWGTLSKYLKQKTVYLPNLQRVAQQLGLQYQKVVCFLPQTIAYYLQIPNYDLIVGVNKGSVSNIRKNVKGINTTVSKLNQRQRFDTLFQKEMLPQQNKISLKTIKAKQNQPKNILSKYISEYEVNQIGIPLLLYILIAYFKVQPEGLMKQGIFRKSVSIDEQNNILVHIANKDYDYLQKVQNPHLIANLIKRFLAGLKTPIIPYEQFAILMKDQSLQNVKKVISPNFGGKLKRINYITLMYLFEFLKDEVISRESHNKMNQQAVAVCFAPCLMKAQIPSMQDLIYAGKSVTVIRCLISNFQQIFGDRKKLKQSYRQSYLIQKKKSIQASRMSLSKELIQSGRNNIPFGGNGQQNQNIQKSFFKKNSLIKQTKGDTLISPQEKSMTIPYTQNQENPAISQKNQEQSQMLTSQDQQQDDDEEFFKNSNKINQQYSNNQQTPKNFNKTRSQNIAHQNQFQFNRNSINQYEEDLDYHTQPKINPYETKTIDDKANLNCNYHTQDKLKKFKQQSFSSSKNQIICPMVNSQKVVNDKSKLSVQSKEDIKIKPITKSAINMNMNDRNSIKHVMKSTLNKPQNSRQSVKIQESDHINVISNQGSDSQPEFITQRGIVNQMQTNINRNSIGQYRDSVYQDLSQQLQNYDFSQNPNEQNINKEQDYQDVEALIRVDDFNHNKLKKEISIGSLSKQASFLDNQRKEQQNHLKQQLSHKNQDQKKDQSPIDPQKLLNKAIFRSRLAFRLQEQNNQNQNSK